VLQANYLDDLYQKPIPTSDVPIITDDYPWRVDTLPVWGWEPERR